MVLIKCQNRECNNIVKITKRGKAKKYCSLKCNHREYYLRKFKIIRKSGVCLNCGKKITFPRKKWCSKKCACKNHYKTHKDELNRKKKFKVICGNPKCDNVIETTGLKKYCCPKCVAVAQYWREKGVTPEEQEVFSNIMNIRSYSWKVRRLFFDLKNNKCEMCNATKNLQIHHKKYVKDHNYWQLLCSNCHKQIHSKKF